jgi:hypothetical protein
MPIPEPYSGESEDEFMNRCMSFVIGEGTDQNQAYAICSTQWEESKMLFDDTKFKTKKELYDFLVNNKESLISQKKALLKHADCVMYQPSVNIDISKKTVNKANEPITIDSLESIKVIAVINTTNIIDSHLDMHLNGLWNKSVKENKSIMHLQEHKMAFDKIISDGDKLKAYVKNYTWKELGFDYDGETEALVFESTIDKERNEFMFRQYANGWVKQHSVGMRYVQLVMCINDKDYGAEYEAWEKYFPLAVNKEVAEERGYFWVVKEGKAIEGSAVLLGSNFATPTLDNNSKSIEPSHDTQSEPEESTQKGIDYKYLRNNLKLR